jgi:hypothetical protein
MSDMNEHKSATKQAGMARPDAGEVVRREFPARSGEFRIVHDLFGDGTFFRVNFHDQETNLVVRSYFVHVKDGQVNEPS